MEFRIRTGESITRLERRLYEVGAFNRIKSSNRKKLFKIQYILLRRKEFHDAQKGNKIIKDNQTGSFDDDRKTTYFLNFFLETINIIGSIRIADAVAVSVGVR